MCHTRDLNPQVDDGLDLTREELTRYSRHLSLPEVGVDGQKKIKNLKGGILAWSKEIDSSIPIY